MCVCLCVFVCVCVFVCHSTDMASPPDLQSKYMQSDALGTASIIYRMCVQ